jgi:hypothetical protein
VGRGRGPERLEREIQPERLEKEIPEEMDSATCTSGVT